MASTVVLQATCIGSNPIRSIVGFQRWLTGNIWPRIRGVLPPGEQLRTLSHQFYGGACSKAGDRPLQGQCGGFDFLGFQL